jgi:hypothetical protein
MFIQKIKNWFFSLFTKDKIGMTNLSNFLSRKFSGNDGIFCRDIRNGNRLLCYIECDIVYPTHTISIGFRVNSQTSTLSISFISFRYNTTKTETFLSSLSVLFEVSKIFEIEKESIQQFLTSNNYNWE